MFFYFYFLYFKFDILYFLIYYYYKILYMYYLLFAMIVNIWIFGIRTTSSLELSKGLAPQFQAEFSGLQGLHQFAYISL